MVPFRDLSIRKKITLILMGISTAAVLVACLAFYSLVINQYKQSYRSELISLAKVVGYNCRAALLFDVPEDAEQILFSLRNHPTVLYANVYDVSDEIFAAYYNESSFNGPLIPKGRKEWDSPEGTLLIQQEIHLDDGSFLGKVTLRDNLQTIVSFQKMALLTLLIVVVVVLCFAFVLAARVSGIISKPIGDLAKLTEQVSKKQDYSLRAVKYGSDEVGNLVDTFNNMLIQIQKRNDDLQESEKRFRALVNQAMDGFFLHDINGNLVDVNYRACVTLGYSRDELLSRTFADIDMMADNTLYKEKYWGRMIPGSSVTVEGMHRRKDGTTFPVEVKMGLLELGSTQYIMSLVRDISGRIQAEKEKYQLRLQLQQSQKMESIGTLAGGIAHDFNNVLSPIFGYIDLALLNMGDDDTKIKSYLQEVNKAAHRAKELVSQILTFSRQDSQQQSAIQIQPIIKEALKLLRASIPSNIEMRQQIDADCGSVLANSTQIHQILMNLCTNAYHSMRKTGGVLAISLTQVDIKEGDLAKSIHLSQGQYLRLEVSDTGYGIDDEILDRIFDPYFTTKGVAEGTGMGLAVVHGIVKSYGGTITVYSEPGEGTTFHLYFPVVESAAELEDEGLGKPAPEGNEKILLVDDELSVLKTEENILESLGYDVTAMLSPLAALELFKEDPQAFAMVISDMTMPKMTGDVLVKEILAVRREIPIIMCTGFSEVINKERAMDIGAKEYIMKPVERKNLAVLMRKHLDGTSSEQV